MLKRSEFSADDLLYIHYFGRAHAHLGVPVCWIIERVRVCLEASTKVGPDQLGPPVRLGSTRIDSDQLGSNKKIKIK